MYCPVCHHGNPSSAVECGACRRSLVELRDRVFIGRQFIFLDANEEHPVALGVDDAVQSYHAPAILSRHQHAFAFGDDPWSAEEAARQPSLPAPAGRPWPPPRLPPLSRLEPPRLEYLTIVSDRKIYKPGEAPTLFVIAPDAAGLRGRLEIQLADQKVYETTLELNGEGLALHTYPDVREGEYKAIVSVPGIVTTADCSFSAAEYTLSPLIATLRRYEYDARTRTVSVELGVLLLSQPYAGPLELRLHCPECGRIAGAGIAPQPGRRILPWIPEAAAPAPLTVQAVDGVATASLALCHHDGPFRLEAVAPQGHTASLALPNLGRTERERIPISRLGRGADLSLAPWAGADAVRGCYVGGGDTSTTPLFLDSVVAAQGVLRAVSDLAQVQIVTVNPRDGVVACAEQDVIAAGATLNFEVPAPYALFTVAAFTPKGPFEGWGVVVRPVEIEASLTAAAEAAPGDEVEVFIDLADAAGGAYCWLLAYDARLEHESPLPRLGKRIFESLRSVYHRLGVGQPPDAGHWRYVPDDLPEGVFGGQFLLRALVPPGPVYATAALDKMVQPAPPSVVQEARPALEAVESPARMDFPELVHNELLWVAGTAARTIRLGQQIGTWRVRAYLLRGVDCRELTTDVQAEKPVYAELDLPALASDGDDITASVTYRAGEGAQLVIDTPFGRTESTVSGAGRQTFPIRGPGKVEVTLSGRSGGDWSVREVARPGVQRVTASRLAILRQNETVRAERAVVYAAVGHVLKDTITALIGYPFG